MRKEENALIHGNDTMFAGDTNTHTLSSLPFETRKDHFTWSIVRNKIVCITLQMMAYVLLRGNNHLFLFQLLLLMVG